MNMNFSASPNVHGDAIKEAGPLHAPIEAARSIAIIVSDHDGTVAAWSRGAQTMFGYAEEEVLGEPLSMLASYQCPLPGETIDSSKTVSGAEQARWYRRKDGTRIFCNEVLTVLPGLPGHAPRCVLYLCDATPLYERLESMQRRLTEQEARYGEALRADASKDRCLAVISHELKQPLTTILMGIERVLESTSGFGGKRVADDLQAIRNATRRQAKIVDDLLELSRIRTGKIRLDPLLVDVGEVVRLVATAMAEDTMDRRIRVQIDAAQTHRASGAGFAELTQHLLEP